MFGCVFLFLIGLWVMFLFKALEFVSTKRVDDGDQYESDHSCLNTTVFAGTPVPGSVATELHRHLNTFVTTNTTGSSTSLVEELHKRVDTLVTLSSKNTQTVGKNKSCKVNTLTAPKLALPDIGNSFKAQAVTTSAYISAKSELPTLDLGVFDVRSVITEALNAVTEDWISTEAPAIKSTISIAKVEPFANAQAFHEANHHTTQATHKRIVSFETLDTRVNSPAASECGLTPKGEDDESVSKRVDVVIKDDFILDDAPEDIQVDSEEETESQHLHHEANNQHDQATQTEDYHQAADLLDHDITGHMSLAEEPGSSVAADTDLAKPETAHQGSSTSCEDAQAESSTQPAAEQALVVPSLDFAWECPYCSKWIQGESIMFARFSDGSVVRKEALCSQCGVNAAWCHPEHFPILPAVPDATRLFNGWSHWILPQLREARAAASQAPARPVAAPAPVPVQESEGGALSETPLGTNEPGVGCKVPQPSSAVTLVRDGPAPTRFSWADEVEAELAEEEARQLAALNQPLELTPSIQAPTLLETIPEEDEEYEEAGEPEGAGEEEDDEGWYCPDCGFWSEGPSILGTKGEGENARYVAAHCVMCETRAPMPDIGPGSLESSPEEMGRSLEDELKDDFANSNKGAAEGDDHVSGGGKAEEEDGEVRRHRTWSAWIGPRSASLGP